MARHGYSHSSDFGFDIGGLIGLLIILTLILMWILIRMSAYIVQTFVKYHKASKALWYSLAIFVLLAVLGTITAAVSDSQTPLAFAGIGFVQLFFTCVVVQRKYAECFLVGDGVSIKQAILERSWWADETTPIAA